MKGSVKQRLVSAAAILITLGAVVSCNTFFRQLLNIVVSVVCVMCVCEIISALGLLKKPVLVIPSLVFAAVLPFLTDPLMKAIGYFVYTVLLFGGMLLYHKLVSFREMAVIYSVALFIPTSLQSLVLLRDVGGSHGMFYLLVAIFAAWAADAGAFVIGSLCGKHKLCPLISPKKTVEGAVGGVVVNVGIMLLFGAILQYLYWDNTVDVNFIELAVIGAAGAALSILGDLSFSIVKRSCHIKDFSEIIPGHGGMLDRFDSVIFVAPFAYILVQIVPLVVG